MVGAVKRPIFHYRTKFCNDRRNRCGDIVIIQDGGPRHFGFYRARTATIHEDYLVVFIVVLNVVGIAAVLSII